MRQTIAVVDFGSQYTQLIARRVRENHVYSIIVPPTVTVEKLREINAVGLIFSGGPSSVYEQGAPRCDKALLDMGLPVLGICYGLQLACLLLGSKVGSAKAREYGRTHLTVVHANELLANVPEEMTVWMSHGDVVNDLSADFVPLARTANCPIAAVKHATRAVYGVQFHPEVTHTPNGSQILRNFLYEVCRCAGDWKIGSFIDETVESVARLVKPDERVICGLSGGVDSSVAAVLLHKALGDRLTCIFVDNGLLRMNEAEVVEATFRGHFHIDLRVVDASERFLTNLRGVKHPQEKRKIIGREFIEVFKSEARSIPNARFLAQGTLYPDVIESGHNVAGTAANIKLHHNVGGLPAELGFELIEPFRELFKDEVRLVGGQLGLPDEIVWRHPFPGPGLAVRIIGDITPERLKILREADTILLEEIRSADWYRKISQAFAVLLPVASVGVMGDARAYEGQNVIAVRCVDTTDFMTADWTRVDYELLAQASGRIMNEVKGVNRVVYDISSKPPSTIEWE
jgi:GMP synthase (glutamine-hydrolysing)